jgi:RNA polymerase-binding transcription factor DksA
MSEDEWDATPWATQRAYLEGLDEDQEVPFGWSEDTGSELPFTRREAVDAGTDVIDLAAMRSELEEQRRKRAQGGD